ncbi:MAG TPA: hypothetical protein VMF88_15465 [Bacteroidota bacterium]|nr:hypothetical protein [Bacteroidota bacterium]
MNATFDLSTGYFRDLVRKPRKGNLKVHMARVPSPGLFDRMIAEGKKLLSFDLDVVVALDGERTEADFPRAHVVKAKEIPFKNSVFQEMDYEGIVARSPEVAIIDNLLHVNISGADHEMRYQEVRDLLDRGISVITSTYSPFGNNLKGALENVSGIFSIPFHRWAGLPLDELITLVFAPKESFHHAEVGLSEETVSIE